jgi:toxin ParE1/3/4
MALKPLEWSKRAIADVDGIFAFYAETASVYTANNILDEINKATCTAQSNPLAYRAGQRGTRELVMKRYPFVLIYRAYPTKLRIVRVLHQAREYFSI